MCLRYVVPFRYHESFEQACKKVENQKEQRTKMVKATGKKKVTEKKSWSRKIETLDGPESDLYAYIRNEFRFDNETKDLAEQKAGCEWVFWRSDEAESKDGKKIEELLYFPNGIVQQGKLSNESFNVVISNVGLLLFRNGLGFLWYEIKTPKMNSRQLMLFQNKIRELNHGNTFLWEIGKSEPEDGFVYREIKGIKTYLSPFSLGMWINEKLEFLKISYFAERKSAYEGMVKKSMAQIRKLSDEIVCVNNSYQNVDIKVPDKAILFTYVSLEKKNFNTTLEDKLALVYHITNGYKDSYHFSNGVVNEIKGPFDDAYWYATQEGVAYLVWTDYDNKTVFTDLIPGKVRTDYFTLYLKTLYQSFSLLIYAEKIQKGISAIDGEALGGALESSITTLLSEINLFLTKSMATSVSHIHHQSEFYVYLKKRLRVYEDIKSVTAGLNSLDFLQREQRDKEELKEKEIREEREKKSDGKIQAIMGLFAMLGISSALVDCFDFVKKFSANGEWMKLSERVKQVELVFMLIIGGISIVAIIFAVKAIVAAFGDKD